MEVDWSVISVLVGVRWLLQKQEGTHSQHHQEEGGGHQNPQGGCLLHGPHSRQGSSPGVSWIRANILTNIWPFLMIPRSTNPAWILPKNYREMSIKPFNSSTETMGSSRLHWWSKQHYHKLLATGNTSPAPRFYGLPKIHKANCPMQPIVSACGTATYQLAKFLTKILQKYTGITPTFVKDSKGFSQYLRSVHLGQDEELVSFDISALFTSIPVPTALEVINWLFTEHIEVPEAKGK